MKKKLLLIMTLLFMSTIITTSGYCAIQNLPESIKESDGGAEVRMCNV